MGDAPRSAWAEARASVAVGVVTTAVVGLAMWRSPAPWTFTLDSGSVFLGQTLPAFRAWFSGQIPEWSDLLWGGFPLVGDCTSAVFYPPHALAYLLTVNEPLRFFDVAFALHLGLFAAGSTALVQRLANSAGAGTLAGVLAALTPTAHWAGIAYCPVLATNAWWPWTFLAVEALTRPSTPVLGGAMWLAWAALAAQVLAGVPEQAAYCAVPAALWLVARPSPLGVGARLVRLLVFGLGAVALAAPQLFPTALVLPWSHRAGTPPSYQFGSLWLMHPERLFVPGVGALNGIPSFLGIVTPGLAVVAALAHAPGAAFLLLTAWLAFLLSLGPQVGLYDLVHQVPPFDRFRNPAKIFALAEYAVVWGAALGVAALWRGPARAARAAALVLAAAVLVERAAYVPTAIAAIDANRKGDGLFPERYERLAALKRLHRRTDGTPPLPVFDAGGPMGGEYARSVGALLGISSLHAGSVALLSPAHFELLGQADPVRLGRLGAAFLLAPLAKCPRIAARFAWPLTEASPADCLLAHPRPPPRHVLLERVTPFASAAEMVQAMFVPGDGMPIVAPSGAFEHLGRGVVNVTAYGPGHARLRSATDAPGLVLIRDSLAPGWTATVDGRSVELVPAAGIFFAVPVGAGTQEIALRYRAPGMRAGLLVFAAWIVLGAVATLARHRLSTGTPDEEQPRDEPDRQTHSR